MDRTQACRSDPRFSMWTCECRCVGVSVCPCVFVLVLVCLCRMTRLGRHSKSFASFVPERVEPTVPNGSPPPRRRRHPMPSPLFRVAPTSPNSEMEREFGEHVQNPNYAMKTPKHVVSDSLMSKAFGASPLLFQHAETTSNQTDDELNEIEMLKKLKQLSVSEILHVFQGNDLPPSPSPRQLSSQSSQSSQSSHTNIWPPLPKGPPPVSQPSARVRDWSQC